MKLVSLFAGDRSIHVGALIEDADGKGNRILDFHALEPKSCHANMNEFIEQQAETLPWAKAMIEKARAGLVPATALIPEKDALLAAPVPHPVSCRDGYAFRQHVESARKGRGLPMIPEFDHFPIFYFTNHLAITGPGEVFVMEKALERMDFELEVAIVDRKSVV